MSRLSPEQISDLRTLAAEPFHMAEDWATDGHRRRLFFFTNEAGDIRLPIRNVTRLSELLTMEDHPTDKTNMIVRASSAGAALLRVIDMETAERRTPEFCKAEAV